MGKSKRLKRSNKAVNIVMVVYMVLFIVLALNIIRYLAFESDYVVLNPYNKRLDEIEKEIVRGTIYDKDKVPLAETVIVNDEATRVYPYENIFAHVIGYNAMGKSGLEALYNIDLLRNNEPFYKRMWYDFTDQKKKGNHIVTTLDLELQKKAYELLGEHKGAIIGIEPSTGKIVCMVSKPDFNPNAIDEEWNDLNSNEELFPLYNRATQGLYPPGSTFKIVTLMAYLEENDEDDFHYTCGGEDDFGSRHIKCYEGIAHGEVNLKEAFAKSCNTSFAKIGETVNRDYLRNLSEELLFNNVLPFNLPYSVSRFELTNQSTVDMAVETAIGQGETLISPLHNALITATIANGGIMMEPYLLDCIIDDTGKEIYKNYPTMYRQLIEPDMTTKLTEYMTEVVESGTGKMAKIEGIKVAGKTGTAENSEGDDHGWFVGFAPADRPEIVFSVIVENAGSSAYYSVPIAKELFEEYLKNN